MGYEGSPLGTADIARALKVNHVLEGSVRKSGNHVRITAQLIDAVNDRHLWSETYDRELTDIFAIQGDIANAIVEALRGQLGGLQSVPAVRARADTENLEAYQLYLKARELFIARKDLPESIRLFEQVTQMDPEFARGWEGLAAVSSVGGPMATLRSVTRLVRRISAAIDGGRASGLGYRRDRLEPPSLLAVVPVALDSCCRSPPARPRWQGHLVHAPPGGWLTRPWRPGSPC